MKISVKSAPLSTKTCLILGVFEDQGLSNTGKQVDKLCKGYLTKLIRKGVFSGKAGQILPLFHPNNSKFEQILLVGCGKSTSFKGTSFRKAIVSMIKSLNTLKISRAICYFGELPVENHSLSWKVKQICDATWDALYRFDLFKSEKQPEHALKDLIIDVASKGDIKECEQICKQSEAIGKGITFSKNLANLPSNICTPSFLAEQAKQLAKSHKSLTVKILDENEMQKLGMGALLAVSQGSSEAAKLICLEYKGTSKQQAPIAFVGKGVTFDTGGISLKPADGMVGMKYDMCGAATVLGTISAACELQLPLHLVGIIPTVENMPGGTAYKPEDIVTTLSGKTVEVMNTDAEGRLILCDALTYCERYKPDVVIDIATLTGAVVIALGIHATALYSNNDALAKALLKAGIESHDRAWQMPLWDEYQEQLRSPYADISNVGGKPAGSITAACFLANFTKKFKWAHLDVAGTAAMMFGTHERMSTGRPIPLLIQYLIDRSASDEN